jgi:anti-anti-sigma factor
MTLSVRFQKSQQGSQYYVKIIGIMDYSTIDAFQEGMDIPENINHVTLDFSGLEFIDSTGIGSLLGLMYTAQERGWSIGLVELTEEIKEVFDTVGVFRVMEALRRGGMGQ